MEKLHASGKVTIIIPSKKWKDSKVAPEKLGGVERTNRKKRALNKTAHIQDSQAYRIDKRTERKRQRHALIAERKRNASM